MILNLEANYRTWNLGDTSFRRKNIMEDYYTLLSTLEKFRTFYPLWSNVEQADFFRFLVENTNLIESSETDDSKMAKRGRTMTNGLEKIGLCNKKRQLTGVGTAYLNLDTFKIDKYEERLVLKKENILFLRQLLKLSIYDSVTKKSFSPFIFALRLLSKYENIPQEHFKLIMQNTNPNYDLDNVVASYKKVHDKKITIEQFCDEIFYSFNDNPNIKNFIETGEGFREVFKNRKTPNSVEVYEDFYNNLLSYNSNKNDLFFDKLIGSLKTSEIKRAFGVAKYFDMPRGNLDNRTFLSKNKDLLLLKSQDAILRNELVRIFEIAKTSDIINEYYDMTVRVFNLSGIISFSYGNVSISNLYVKETYGAKNNIFFEKHTPIDEYDNYFYENSSSTMEILDITLSDMDILDKNIIDKYNLIDDDINTFISNEKENQFKEFVESTFNKSNLVEILKHISERNDKKVNDLVTDNATIPTIFEYIMAIAWHRISDGGFKLLESMNLSLDGSYLPLSHAIGGDGDVVIDYGNHFTMLEVTLMDINTQKRGELEPVIRHSTNLTIEVSPKPTYNFFIANELDNNVVNIFRACSMLSLESSRTKGKYVDGVKIVSFTISDIIAMLEHNIKYSVIKSVADKEFNNSNNQDVIVDNAWREKIIKQIIPKL